MGTGDKISFFKISNIQVGDRVTRFYQKDMWDADVLEITDEHIICGMNVDTYRTMKFDRKTGVSEHGKAFGFIINAPLETSQKMLALMEKENVDPSNDVLAKLLDTQKK